MNVLVINAGSSSLKYQLMNTESGIVKAKGNCERIGIDGGNLKHKVSGKEDFILERFFKNHAEAVAEVVKALTDKDHGCIASMKEIEAVGHRVVHGGPYFTGAVLLADDVMEKLERCKDLAPLHIPGSIDGINGCLAEIPDVPQVLVFDTAFHQTMPEEAYCYPVNYELCQKYAIRRYGFHGSSHKYVSREAVKLLGGKAEGTKIITCHLGGGSSIAAVKDGKVIDTTMGFTPLDGLMMGTRSGAIDPAIVTFLMEKEGLTPAEMDTILNKRSGLESVSGVSSDCRDIVEAAANGNKRAALAKKVFCYQIKKYIGAYAAAMNGVDAIVFTAGIGENNALFREGAVEGLDYLGVKLDKAVNSSQPRPAQTALLSTEDSKVKIYLIPTNEELVIATDTAEIVEAMNR